MEFTEAVLKEFAEKVQSMRKVVVCSPELRPKIEQLIHLAQVVGLFRVVESPLVGNNCYYIFDAKSSYFVAKLDNSSGKFTPLGPSPKEYFPEEVKERDKRPHSRACRIYYHPHGEQCAINCPTCGWVQLLLHLNPTPLDTV